MLVAKSGGSENVADTREAGPNTSYAATGRSALSTLHCLDTTTRHHYSSGQCTLQCPTLAVQDADGTPFEPIGKALLQ